MAPPMVGKDAGTARAGEYAQHQPEQTLLYQLVEAHYPMFVARLAARDLTLPAHVQREFEDYLKCGRLEHGFLRFCCADCHAERLVAFSCKRRGFCPSCGARRMAEGAASYHGVFAPNHHLREQVTPANEPAPARHVAMTWATFEAGVQVRPLDLRTLWWRGEGDREHRRSSGDQTDPCASRAASRARDTRLQTLRPRAAANGITGREGIRLTVLCADLRTDARLV